MTKLTHFENHYIDVNATVYYSILERVSNLLFLALMTACLSLVNISRLTERKLKEIVNHNSDLIKVVLLDNTLLKSTSQLWGHNVIIS